MNDNKNKKLSKTNYDVSIKQLKVLNININYLMYVGHKLYYAVWLIENIQQHSAYSYYLYTIVYYTYFMTINNILIWKFKKAFT